MVRSDITLVRVEDQPVAILVIRNPKTRRFLGRTQHVVLRDRATVAWLQWYIVHVNPVEALWPFTYIQAAKMLKALLAIRNIPVKFSLGSLRAGGATYLYLCHADLGRLMFTGRWTNMRTLKIYVQEAVASMVLASFDASIMSTFAQLTQFLLEPPTHLASQVLLHGRLRQRSLRSSKVALPTQPKLESWGHGL